MPRHFDPHPPLSPAGRETITNLVRHGNALIEQRKQLGDRTVQDVQPLDERAIEYLLDAVVNLDCGAASFAPPMSFAHIGDVAAAFQGAEHLEPAHLARLFALYGAIRFDSPVRFGWGAAPFLEFLHTGPLADYSLDDYCRSFPSLGLDVRALVTQPSALISTSLFAESSVMGLRERRAVGWMLTSKHVDPT
ncbi:MAG: hypothetical protein H6509_14655 [Bryobacterales bacterium]|nr:hypothetical protein [Acidobacteriota bacterium]MCB9385847.1 hypothetical protein [Bryobacterales bacterium]